MARFRHTLGCPTKPEGVGITNSCSHLEQRPVALRDHMGR